MARQIKDNADYFTHDTDMRDDPKIKALRRKFKAEGYGIWCMLLELITDSDNFRLPIEYEIIAGDMDVEPDLLISILNYCVQIGLLQTDEGCKNIWSKTLDKRFEPLLSKRERDRDRLSLAKIPNNKVIASESTQSRVENSREEQSKEENKDSVYDLLSNPSGLYIIVKDPTKIPIKIHQQSFNKWLEGTFGLVFEAQKMSIKSKPPIEEFFKARNGDIYDDNNHVWSAFKKMWLLQPTKQKGGFVS